MVFVAFPICEHIPPEAKTQIEKTSGTAIDVIIDSPGGDLQSAYVIVRELRRRFTNVSVFVPLMAKSAATLISLAADELVLGELGELGPLDTQLEEKQRGDFPRTKSCLERFKALEQLQRHAIETFELLALTVMAKSGMQPLDACTIAAEFTGKVCGQMYAQVHPDGLGQDARYLAVGQEYLERVFRRYRPELDDADEIVQAMVKGYPSHDFAIDLEELEDLGIPARTASKEEAPILDAFALAIWKLRPLLEHPQHPEHGTVQIVDETQAAETQATEEQGEGEPHATSKVEDSTVTTSIRKVK